MSTGLRVALGADGVSIWSSEIFGGDEPSKVRDFLSRAFAVQEVEGVELRRKTSFGRIRYGSAANPAQIWKKLSRALSSPAAGAESVARALPPRIDAGSLYLDGPGAQQIHISRIGAVLSTWRLRHQGEGTLRLSHPRLRNRRDIVFRLEEELASILGVEAFRASALTARVSIRFDGKATTPERLLRELEQAWPRLLQGLDGPPSQKRLVAAVGLVGLSFTGQYLAPAVRPLGVAGMALYSLPNVVNGAKQLTRGEIGLSALYSTGVAFMLVSGLPFAASVFATLMQLWPHLAHRKLVRSQRRIFAGLRRRPTRARLLALDGAEVEVSADDLHGEDRIVVRRGELIPVDGVVEDGVAVVVTDAILGQNLLEDRVLGDSVSAGSLVRDGSLTIRVERAGTQTFARYLDSLLPRAALSGLPSSLEAERIANRNAKPALALSAASLLLTRTLLPAQAVIRPDYATAPRLSAQLSGLQGIADGLQRGVVFRNPAALDRLAAADRFVIDDTAGLERQRLQVSKVQAVKGVTPELVAGYAAAGRRSSPTEQARALGAFAAKRHTVQPIAGSLQRYAGVTRYRDSLGAAIEIASPGYLAASNIALPERFHSVLTRRRTSESRVQPDSADPEERPLWVLRDGQVIGGVAFARSGEPAGEQVVAALRAHHEQARIVYLSRHGGSEARALARRLGIEFSRAGSSPGESAGVIRRLGQKTLWIGDGSQPDAKELIAASSVSVSVAPLARAREDAADVLLPQRGLSGVADVLQVGRAHAERLAADYQTVYALNLLGVAGALFARMSGLQTGLLSNLGTGWIYARHAWALDRLAAASDRKRARLQAPEHSGVVRELAPSREGARRGLLRLLPRPA